MYFVDITQVFLVVVGILTDFWGDKLKFELALCSF